MGLSFRVCNRVGQILGSAAITAVVKSGKYLPLASFSDYNHGFCGWA
jgi:hypothetical protein